MRRLKRSDPAYDIYQAYAEEHSERWASATALSMDQALAEMPEIERKYLLECEEYENVLFGMSEELAGAAKLEQEQLAKLADADELQAQLDSGAFVAVEDGARVTDADHVAKSIYAFEAKRDKSVDAIMATKLPSLDRKK